MDTVYKVSKTVAAWVAVCAAVVTSIGIASVAHYRIGEIGTTQTRMEGDVRKIDHQQVEILTDLKWIRASLEVKK